MSFVVGLDLRIDSITTIKTSNNFISNNMGQITSQALENYSVRSKYTTKYLIRCAGFLT